MHKLNAIVIDDEKGVRELLKLLIEKHCPHIQVVGEARDADEAFKKITEKHPDLVFLDIQMPKGDGFSLLKRFARIDFDVIFTTSYGEYAVWAFKVDAVDYILKPYDVNDLKKAVDKVVRKRDLLGSGRKNEEAYIQIHKNDKVEKIYAKHIISLEAQNNYTLITTEDGQKHLTAKVMADLEEALSTAGSFIRIHRSVVVNSPFIKSYSKVPPYTIIMQNDVPFEISRRRRSEILDILKHR
jgi:two-component system, LytTR family, response regulator